MLVNTTIFETEGEAKIVANLILAMKAQLDQLHNKYCLTDTEVPTRETALSLIHI